MWQATGTANGMDASGLVSDADAAALGAQLQASRRLRKPRTVRVNVKSVVTVMRAPGSHPFSFTKPLPLRDLVAICNGIWREEEEEARK